MEKPRITKLTELADFDCSGYEGLEGIIVESVDLYKERGVAAILCKGSDSVSDASVLVDFIKRLSKSFRVTIRLGFDDISLEDLSDRVSKLWELIAYDYYVVNSKSLDSQVSFGDKDGITFEILVPSSWSKLYEQSQLTTFKEELMNAIGACTYVDPETEGDVTIRFAGAEKAELLGAEELIDKAIREGNFIDIVPEDLPKKNGKKTEGQSDKAPSKEPDKEEGTQDKNSWAYKAKQQLKEAKIEEKAKPDYKHNMKAEGAIFGRVKMDGRLLKIKDAMIGDRDINLIGDVTITDDLRLTKSCKSVIAKFLLMDDTDAISCIAFLKPNEADIFQKTFKKGGFAGFQGDIETDTFTGDKQLRVSGAFPADKPAPRRDNASRKRVELHVHTKMSDNDATTEPADLVSLAASFGHTACAVTDHGVVQAFPHVFEKANKINKGKAEGETPFKCILGCEGYLVDDGPTVFYNLPYDADTDDKLQSKAAPGTEDAALNFINKAKPVGSFVAITIRRNGKDALRDTFTAVAASKFRLKGFKYAKTVMEGESDEDAMEFASHDIDKSIWNMSELPPELSDESIAIPPKPEHDKYGRIYNKDLDIDGEYAEDYVIPGDIVFEHVADFYAEFEDSIYPGKGEPCQSYFAMGELLEFIGDSYITGPDIFTTLAFLRRAGYGINIEDQVYYRHKFLMPATSDEDILKTYYEGKYKDCDELLRDKGLEFVIKRTETGADELLEQCYISADVLIAMLKDAGKVDPLAINYDKGHFTTSRIKSHKKINGFYESPTYHIIYLARSNMGLYNMYRLVSEAHIHYFSMRPRTPKSLLKYYSSGMIVGGACERGEIYRFVIRSYKEHGKDRNLTREFLKTSPEFAEILSLYDYVEIQPLCNNVFLTRQDPQKSDTGNVAVDEMDIQIVNELLVETADDHGMPCCATTDSHFLNKEDGRFRKTLLMGMGFSDAELQSDLYFRTTEEMLGEFAYLGEKKAEEVVIDNTNMIADLIEFGIKPFPAGSYPPQIARAAADVRDIAYTRANKLYRHNGVLDPLVKARLDKELISIISNGYAIMYYIAYRLVKKSNNDGYIVGSRGSVGSSFAATMCGISEVNPLPPHHRCPKCNYARFDSTGNYGSGYDLPEEVCPECGTKMIRDGQDIPFETFLGFKGDKQPDIDLNFSGEYQPRAHAYVGVLFGGTHTFKAGTIGAYQDKNAYGVCRKILEEKGEVCTQAHLAYMSRDIIGVKRTTSQHPGGIVVIAKEMDVYEFTPIQFPANKTDCGIITTHFDFRAMHDTILKLDILGHADPTVLRMLHEITDVNITDIPIPDDKVMALLKGTDVLGFPVEATDAGSATLGLSELGTNMARGMIKETKPTRFYDLVQLMGLSHGTDVWTGNAQDLIREGICDINSVIGCRDSIMTRLIYWGLPNKDAFDIMEAVRKGKVAKGEEPRWPQFKEEMKECGVPDWYIDSCNKIKYMFPKAHAAAYSISTLRVAWFKVYYPEEYYCAFFTIRGEGFDAETMCFGPEKVKKKRLELQEKMRTSDNPNTKNEYYLCELVEEMYARGITFAPISLTESDGKRFKKVSKGVIIPPFSAIDSVSEGNGKAICEAREEGPFKNREDFMLRTGVGQAVTQKLLSYGGILDDLPESAQIDLFSLLDGN
ncbi:MAG: PolC-type DNA polymerase III [Saccharofermentans sp.]|nr:PolC-type DNA polymerase III [Saccharofermentans sp.]